jgi:hypothetical protein
MAHCSRHSAIPGLNVQLGLVIPYTPVAIAHNFQIAFGGNNLLCRQGDKTIHKYKKEYAPFDGFNIHTKYNTQFKEKSKPARSTTKSP